MVNFGALLANKQLMFEFGHVIVATVLTGSTIITGLAAFQLLKKHTLSDINKKNLLQDYSFRLDFNVDPLLRHNCNGGCTDAVPGS